MEKKLVMAHAWYRTYRISGNRIRFGVFAIAKGTANEGVLVFKRT